MKRLNSDSTNSIPIEMTKAYEDLINGSAHDCSRKENANLGNSADHNYTLDRIILMNEHHERDEFLRRYHDLSHHHATIEPQPEIIISKSDCDPEVEREEESRMQTEQDMLHSPRQRAFMERVMPIEWCHARYPMVYQT